MANRPLSDPDVIVGPVLTHKERVLRVANSGPLENGTSRSPSMTSLTVRSLARCSSRREIADRAHPAGDPVRSPVAANCEPRLMSIAAGEQGYPRSSITASDLTVTAVAISELPIIRGRFVWRTSNRSPRIDALARVVTDLLGQRPGMTQHHRGAGPLPAEYRPSGPQVRIIEHQAHAPGHAALLIEERGVLVAGDMLSDVLIPMLDLSTADPIEDYLTALRMFERVAGNVDVLVPGHGSIGGAGQVGARIEKDRIYVHALRYRLDLSDQRVGPSAKEGWDWVAGVHAGQLQGLAQRRAHSRTVVERPSATGGARC